MITVFHFGMLLGVRIFTGYSVIEREESWEVGLFRWRYMKKAKAPNATNAMLPSTAPAMVPAGELGPGLSGTKPSSPLIKGLSEAEADGVAVADGEAVAELDGV